MSWEKTSGEPESIKMILVSFQSLFMQSKAVINESRYAFNY